MIKLNKLNIAKDNFKNFIGKNYDIKKLDEYYSVAKEKTDRLVLEDEYVGISYTNLNYLEKIIFENNNKKLCKRMLNR